MLLGRLSSLRGCSVAACLTCVPNPGQGTLRGYDQTTNLILEDCHERVYSTKYGVEQLVLGLYIIRGDNV
eukprot:evm.model.scf_1135.3 EVM.evm.TU.scf_1135.3   scf_1135:28253-28551(-)